MNLFNDPNVIRPVNIVVLLLIVTVLSLRHARHHRGPAVDEWVASVALILVFSVLAFGAGVNYKKGVEMGPIVPYLTIALTALLIALSTPWRWRLHRPHFRDSTPGAS